MIPRPRFGCRGPGRGRVVRVEAVGNTVSAELFQGGLIALGISFLAMLLYIWFRFEWHFGVAAIATLLLDTTKTVGLMVLFGIEFNLTTVAAILTVIGFSANDKVVVFDRMRENLRKFKQMPLRELVDHAKARPGQLNIGSSGVGTSLHMTGELLKNAAGIDMAHVPFRGAGPMLQEVIAGRIQVAVDNLPSVIGHIRDGRLRALAVTTSRRRASRRRTRATTGTTPTATCQRVASFCGVRSNSPAWCASPTCSRPSPSTTPWSR